MDEQTNNKIVWHPAAELPTKMNGGDVSDYVLAVVTGFQQGFKSRSKGGKKYSEPIIQEVEPRIILAQYYWMGLNKWVSQSVFSNNPRVVCWTELPDVPAEYTKKEEQDEG